MSTSSRILKAMSMFGIVQVLQVVCAVVRAKLVTIWVGAAGVGLLSLFNSTTESFKSITLLNLRQGAVQGLGEHINGPDYPKAVHAVGSLALWLGMGGALLMAALSPLLSLFTFGDFSYTWGFALLSLTILLTAVYEGRNAILQISGNLKGMARATAIGFVGGTIIAIPLLYFFRLQAIIPILIVFPSCVFVAVMCQKTSVKPIVPAPDFRNRVCRNVLKLGFYITIGSVWAFVAEYLLRVWLNHTAGIDTVGYFQAGYSIVNSYVNMIFLAIVMEFYPRLSRIIRSTRATSLAVSHEIGICIWVLMPIVALFLTCEDLVVKILYSSDFLVAEPYLTIAILATPLRAFSWCCSYVIISKADGALYMFTEGMSALILLVLSYFGWQMFGFAGLGAAYLGQYIIFTTVVWEAVRKKYKIELTRQIWSLTAFSCIVMAAAGALRWFAPWWSPALLLIFLIPLAIKFVLKPKKH